jgi:TolB protein
LLFYILTQNWNIGLANADGSGFRILKKAEGAGRSFFSGCWMPDGQTLFCQDLENLYQIGLDGAAINQWPLQELFPKGDPDSNMRFDVSPDGRTLIMDVESAADSDRGYPPPSIWAMDLATGKTRRLTPADRSQPCWVTADEFLVTSQGPKDKQPAIYRMSLDGKTRKLVMKNASDPSVSK